MTSENYISVAAIIVSIGLAIFNAVLAKINAGKNRVIYETEQMDISKDNKILNEQLNKKLSSGKYTILSAFVDKGNFTQTRFVIGKIKL